jgi:hypothetical protein
VKRAAALALAFLAGVALTLLLAPRAERVPPVPSASGSAERRQVFSPAVTHDRYFLEQQREGLAALEQHCRDAGELCREAEQLRAWLAEQPR